MSDIGLRALQEFLQNKANAGRQKVREVFDPFLGDEKPRRPMNIKPFPEPMRQQNFVEQWPNPSPMQSIPAPPGAFPPQDNEYQLMARELLKSRS